MREEWIVGKNPVIEALKSGRTMNKVMMLENLKPQSAKQIQQLAKKNGIVVQQVPKKKLDQIGEHHQGVAASIAAYDYASLDDLYDLANNRNETPFFIILDELEDPHNLGSILRTADAVGAHGVIIPKRRSVQLTQTVVKASTGAVEYIPVARVTNIARTIDELKEKNIWVVGTDAKGDEDYRELNGDMPLALVVGSEGKGISRLVRDKCDWLVRLPMKGKVTSLNASVAASLLMYEVYRKRSPLGE
ncbi:23S rRNA (guanosine(2251)-2'-O)-methyltransferase RlmB [Salinibacillus xinjiangensis]|uniref:23S rRNA (Guanosine(2251)-2'-O)-methyltransferase RlmB n=1 Tax=Salinibacillus xinjiangensis TaxID=1229268 RepID=A0A6G1XAR6_9BACI|nr:23S rRNA (guanosine(2251)-2'-O)-methyltransferase RlmB [Salinibacillus xinjiangensis]MRG87996.1 23S rRNA (guanosine(2251)-2'-O)-methyltransferase RlmB [Salinibacillus xinjiangensis]